MEKISITIDLSKIDKTRIVPRAYKDKDGNEFIAKEYKLDVIPLKESKVIKEGATWAMVKKYFIVQAQTKEERAAQAPSVFMGDGIVFEDRGAPQASTNLEDADVPF